MLQRLPFRLPFRSLILVGLLGWAGCGADRSDDSDPGQPPSQQTPGPTPLAVWKSLGPAKAQITTLDFEPRNPSTIYAGTTDNLFKSPDEGNTWTSLALAGHHITDLDLEPASPRTVYAATNGTGGSLRRSLDAGQSWEIVPQPSNIIRVVSNPDRIGFPFITSAYRYALPDDSGRVLRAERNGSWTQLLDTGWYAATDVVSLAISPRDRATLYAGTSSNMGLLRSTDAGASWTRIDRNLQRPDVDLGIQQLLIDPRQPRTLHAAVSLTSSRGLICKSLDAGETWACTDSQLPGSILSLAMAPSNPSTLYAGTRALPFNPEQSRVYRSTDAGNTWTKVADQGLPRADISVLLVDPDDAGVVYAGTNGQGVYRMGAP